MESTNTDPTPPPEPGSIEAELHAMAEAVGAPLERIAVLATTRLPPPILQQVGRHMHAIAYHAEHVAKAIGPHGFGPLIGPSMLAANAIVAILSRPHGRPPVGTTLDAYMAAVAGLDLNASATPHQIAVADDAAERLLQVVRDDRDMELGRAMSIFAHLFQFKSTALVISDVAKRQAEAAKAAAESAEKGGDDE